MRLADNLPCVLIVPLLALGVLVAEPLAAQQQEAGDDRPILVVVGGIDPGGLVVVDPARMEIVRSVTGLAAVHGAAISPDNTRAYALSISEAERAVTVIDLATGTPVREIALEAPAHHAAVDPGGLLYVSFATMAARVERSGGIAVIDPETGTAITIRTAAIPNYVAVSRDASYLYVTEVSPGAVLKITLPDLEVVQQVAVSGGPGHIALSRDGRSIFVTVRGGVVKLDAGTLKLIGEAEAGLDAHAVAIAGEPERLFVANRGSGTLTVLDPGTLEMTATLEIAPLPTHLLRLPSGELLVSAAGSRELIKLDPDALTVLARLPLPLQPHQIAIGDAGVGPRR